MGLRRPVVLRKLVPAIVLALLVALVSVPRCLNGATHTISPLKPVYVLL